MNALIGVLSTVNRWMLRLAYGAAILAMMAMVAIVLLQIILRYVFDNALPWPEEAARFLMLWVTGLLGAKALREGAFVSIDMVADKLPERAAALLTLILMGLSMAVLIMLFPLAWDHVFGFAGRFKSSSLTIPGMGAMPLKYMHMSLLAGVILMIAATAELILRALANVLAPGSVAMTGDA